MPRHYGYWPEDCSEPGIGIIDATPVPCARCSVPYVTIWHAPGICPSADTPEDRILKLELELSVIKNDLREARAKLGFVNIYIDR